MAEDFEVGGYLVEPSLNRTSRGDQVHQIEPRVMELLVYLAEHAGEVLSRDRLIRAVWQDTFVTDEALWYGISELRGVFGDDAKNRRFIETIAKRGYRLIAPVSPKAEAQASRYQIREKIGQGTLGDRYRAHDTRLKREVALQILPQDAQRMARVESEVQVLALLHHPRIARIYGWDETDDQKALVQELVEGETLVQRIGRGPIPLDEALQIALEMVEGLEAAHGKGVIHGDLKPANVKITPEAKVKIVDFGLATASEEVSVTDLSDSPLGSAPYRSPEQARGQAVDQRTDIWAFGYIVYEMLTGRPVFAGATGSDYLARISEEEPDWEALPPHTPWSVGERLPQCLQKNPEERLHEIADARIPIQQALSELAPGLRPPSARVTPQPVWQRVLPWGVAGLLAAMVLIFVTVPWYTTRPAEPGAVRLRIELSPEEPLYTTTGQTVVISPDGQRLAYVAGTAPRRLYVREFDQLEARVLSGTEEADSVKVVPVTIEGGSFRVGTPQQVFEEPLMPANLNWLWDVAPDGNGFVVIRQGVEGDTSRSQAVLVQNWFEELKRLVPTE